MDMPRIHLVLAGLVFGLVSQMCGAATFADTKSAWRSSDAWLLDRNSEVLHQLRLDSTVRRLNWINLENISPALRNVVLHAEDRQFYEHHGVDWRAVAAATVGNLLGSNKRGASTITMQVAALLDTQLAPASARRNISQKWQQMQAAQKLELSWTKNELLEAYLNLATYRGELQGIDAASYALFNKAPSGLTDMESIILVALLPSPNANVTHIAKRACILLKSYSTTISCHALTQLVEQSLQDTRFKMEKSAALHVAQQLLHERGDRIRSTLDWKLQQFASQSLQRHLRDLADRHVTDGAVLVMNNKSGEILAYVGNAGVGSSARYVDGVKAARQAGSTLKPFLYGIAIEKKWLTAASLLDDSSVMLPTSNGLYVPQNYDKEFKGMVSLRTALASSLNIPAVRTLTLVGVETFHARLQQLGYTSLNQIAEFYGHSLALGSADVSLWDQVNAYRAFANGGLWTEPVMLSSQQREPPVRIFSQETAFIISDILSDRAARSLTFGMDNALDTRFWSAVKTGTSKNMRDNWCIGYSNHYTVGVWVGNFDGDPTWNLSGVSGAAPVWSDVMNYLHAGLKNTKPKPARQLVQTQVRFDTSNESSRNEWFIKGTEVSHIAVASDMHATMRIAYPPDGTLIALDPDIPAERQAVFFEVKAQGDFLLNLDGQLYTADQLLSKWQPQAGEHELVLSDGVSVVDTVHFQVRSGKSEPVSH